MVYGNHETLSFIEEFFIIHLLYIYIYTYAYIYIYIIYIYIYIHTYREIFKKVNPDD